MGEAKRRKAGLVSEHEACERALRAASVDTGSFGFYDQPAFLVAEARDSTFLEVYARWVLSRPRSADYEARVREVVPSLTRLLADLFLDAGMQRSCVLAATMMPAIFDRLGIWSFSLKGCLTMEVPGQDIWRGLATVDFPAFEGAELGHAWITAPPFMIVDPTVELQNEPGDPINPFVPRFIAVEEATIARPDLTDIVSAEMRQAYFLREGRIDPNLHHRLEPRMREFGRNFPALETRHNALLLRYVPLGVRMSDTPLEEINSEGTGLAGIEVWGEVERRMGEFIVEPRRQA